MQQVEIDLHPLINSSFHSGKAHSKPTLSLRRPKVGKKSPKPKSRLGEQGDMSSADIDEHY